MRDGGLPGAWGAEFMGEVVGIIIIWAVLEEIFDKCLADKSGEGIVDKRKGDMVD